MSNSTAHKNSTEASTKNDRERAAKNLLLIFTRNPELGKCKTRLAATIGDQSALDVYTFLLQHTAELTHEVRAVKQVWYSEEIWKNDLWNNAYYEKKLQQGDDLGKRMAHAFQEGFESGYERIIVIGSDMYDLSSADIERAFEALENNDFVIGPAADGGYYLLGMRSFNAAIFKSKSWGHDRVFEDTMNDLKNERVQLLAVKNDIDLYEDIKDINVFHPYLKNL